MTEKKTESSPEKPTVLAGLTKNKKIATILIPGLVLILVGLGLAYSSSHKAPSQAQISVALNTGKNADAISLINKAIKLSSSKEERGSLYIELAAAQANSGNSTGAIDAYLKAAEERGMDESTAKQLGEIYAAKGDKTQAIKYYEQAISIWPKKDPLYRAETSALQDKIAALKGEAN